MSYRPARGYIMRPCPKTPKGTKESRVVYLWVSEPSYSGIEEGGGKRQKLGNVKCKEG